MTVSERSLFVGWQSPQNRAIYPVARLLRTAGSPRFELVYIAGVVAAGRHGFVPFTRLNDLQRVYRSNDLFPFLANRLMPASRPDYADYLTRLSLRAPVEPVELLARSQGRKLTDHLELFGPPCFESVSNRWEYLFFVRGVRHIAGAEGSATNLKTGQRLFVRSQADNDCDPRAIQILVTAQSETIGYVPATLLGDIDTLKAKGSQIEVSVVRVNPAPAPIHQRVLVRLLIDHKPGFVPFDTEDYQPLSEEASVLRLPNGLVG